MSICEFFESCIKRMMSYLFTNNYNVPLIDNEVNLEYYMIYEEKIQV